MPPIGTRANGYFTACSPAQNSESTNSFLYCPLLLSHPDALVAWSRTVRWFQEASNALVDATYDGHHLALAYGQLVQMIPATHRDDVQETIAMSSFAEVHPEGHASNLVSILRR